MSCKILLLFLFVALSHGAHPLKKYLHPETEFYNPNLRPSYGTETPTNIKVNTFVRQIGGICLRKEEFKIQLTFRQMFKDSRIAFGSVLPGATSPIRVIGKDVDNFWTPDTFFRESRDVKKLEQYIQIDSDGSAKFSQRVNLRVGCYGLRNNLRETGAATCNIGIASCNSLIDFFHLCR